MANSLTLSGKYLGAKKTEEVGDNKFKKRHFYLDITTDPKFKSTPELVLLGDKVGLVDSLTVNDEITVHINISGRKYVSSKTGKEGVATEIVAWKIEPAEVYTAVVKTQPQTVRPSQPTQMAGFSDDDGSDLPF